MRASWLKPAHQPVHLLPPLAERTSEVGEAGWEGGLQDMPMHPLSNTPPRVGERVALLATVQSPFLGLFSFVVLNLFKLGINHVIIVFVACLS